MGDELNESDFTPQRIEEVREAVRAVIQQHGMTNAAVARDAGVGESTFAAFMSDTYKGNNSLQALRLQRWMTARLAAASVRQASVRGPGFLKTRSSEAFGALLEHAQYTPDFSVIVGAPGVGKTETARAYQRAGHKCVADYVAADERVGQQPGGRRGDGVGPHQQPGISQRRDAVQDGCPQIGEFAGAADRG